MKPALAVDRRRHQRYDAAGIGCRVEWLDERTASELAPLNLSAGGIGLKSQRRVAPGEQIWLRLVLPEPMGAAAVRCIVRWTRETLGGGSWLVGAEIVESTKAWIGPEEDCRHGMVQ